MGVSDLKDSSDTADTVVDDTITVTISVTDVNEPPPKFDPSAEQQASSPKYQIAVRWQPPTMTGKPAITHFDLRYKKKSDSTWTQTDDLGKALKYYAITGLTYKTDYQVEMRAANDEGDGEWSDSGTAITTAGGVTRSVAENSAAGTNVGAAVTAKSTNTTYDYTHALSGTDAGKFEIGSSTGQITVKSGTSLDYETKTSYSVTVTVTAAAKSQRANTQSVDPNAPGDYTVPVTINVTDVNEPPPKLAAPTVAADSTNPTSELDVSWTALTTTQMAGKPAVSDYAVQYKKKSESTWTSHSFTGTGLSTTLTGLSEGTNYEVQVRAVNDEGNGPWSDSGEANTQDKNVHAEFPDTSATRSVAENTAAGGNVGAAITADDTENHTLYYSLNGTDKDEFDIGLNTGQLTVKQGKVPGLRSPRLPTA